MADSSQLPSNAELQQHMKDAFTKPSAAAVVLDQPPGGGPEAEAPMGAEPFSETTPDVGGQSYKSPKELYTAPSSGKVSIAGRRLDTGEVVQSDVIHLRDFAGSGKTSDAGASARSDSPAGPHTPAATSTPTAVESMPSPSTSHTVQETTKSAEQVYATHATVAAAAAAAGGLVGGAHLSVRTAANVAETAVDPAAVVDFDCMSPTSAPADPAGASTEQQQLQEGTPTASIAGQGGADGGAAGQASTQAAAGDSMAGHAVLPEDREDVAATLQRLRNAGQVHSPDAAAGASIPPSIDTASTATAEDTFIGAAAASAGASTGLGPDSGSSAQGTGASSSAGTARHLGNRASCFSAAAGAGHPSAQGVSAGTAAPALAGYPDPTIGTTVEDVSASALLAATAPQEAAPDSNTGSSLLTMHDAAARAAAVAGALAHIGTPISTAAALADTATQPAQAIEVAAAAAGAAAGLADSNTSAPAPTRVPSLHKQHTLAEFLLYEPAAAAAMASHHSADSSAGATAASLLYQVDLSAGTAAADDDFEVQLDVGRSRRLLNPDGRVAAAAATVPDEAVAAINAAESAEAPRSPRHSSLRQLSMPRQLDMASSSQQDQTTSGLPYGLTVADIVAATVASEERRFRVVSPRGSPRGALSPHSAGNSYFTASSGSAPLTPSADAAAAQAVERSSSPMSASATRAIFESVQLAVQQQQQQEQLVQSVARSTSLGRHGGSQPAGGLALGGARAVGAGEQDSGEVSTTARMDSAGSGDSTATSSRPSSAGSAGEPAAAGASSAAMGPAPASITEQNAEVMQEMLQGACSSAQSADALAAGAVSPAAGADTLSTDSTASQYGDEEEEKAAALCASKDGSDVQAGSEVGSSASVGHRIAAAVAAEAADLLAAAAAGMDVAATAAPAFPSVVFGVGATPVDLPAVSKSPNSIDSSHSSAGTSSAAGVAEDLSTAAALASTGLASLDEESSMQDSNSAAAQDSAVQQVVDETAAVVSSAAMDTSTAAAAAAAAAATEMHQESPDPVVAAASAAQLVVNAANTVPGLLAPSDVASAAAAAGAAAAAAATPGMDSASAAVACAAAASNPMGDPEDVAAAAARAVASMQESASASQASAGDGASGQNSSFSGSGGVGGNLTDLLPILAPSGQISDGVPIGSSTPDMGYAVDGGLAGGSSARGPAAPAQLQAVPETAVLEGSTAAGIGGEAGSGRFVGTAEVLNKDGLDRLFDPLIVHLAMATSAPLEGLGLDASTLLSAAGGDAAAIAAAGRAFTNSGSFGSAGSGVLMMQQHPLAGAVSLQGGDLALGPGPVEGSTMYTHLEAAEEALAQLDSGKDLQRQRTDSISLGAGRSSALGELDEAALAVMGGVSGATEAHAAVAE